VFVFDWSDVPIFLAIAEHGSLAKAAVALKTSTATLSRRLEALEAAVGQRIFDRLPNRLVLTDAGRALLAKAQQMRDGADALARVAQQLDGQPAERVRITATQSLSMFLLQHFLTLRSSVPAATIALISTREPLSLARREADLAIRMRRPPESGDLVVRKLGRVAVALYASLTLATRHIQADGRYDVRAMVAVGSMREAKLSEQERWLEQHFGPDRIAFRISETRLRADAAELGLGAVLLPCFMGDSNAALVRLLDPPDALIEDAYLLMHVDLKDLPEIRAMADALVALFSAHRALLAGVQA
jgi:DNA-binding transcriptional LysR family regulator